MAGQPVNPSRLAATPVLDLLDDAFHLLRTRPGTLGVYALGTMPFCLGLLYFWSDMSRSAFAEDRCISGSLVLTVLFVWMKVCHSRFMSTLLADLSGHREASWPPRRYIRAAILQAIIHATAFPVMLAASIVVLPTAWCVAFYHGATLFGNGDGKRLLDVTRLSWEQARLWPRQNHLVLTVLGAFSLVVAAEFLLAIVFLPELMRMFTGIETVFTRSGWSLLNSTLFATAAVLTYLVVDPLVKATYVLRCFYGQSLRSGDDLRAGLMQIRHDRRRRSIGLSVVLLVLALALPVGAPAVIAGTEVRASEPIPPQQLDEAVRRTIEQPRYTWRMPRTKAPGDERDLNPIACFFARIRDWIHDAFDWCWHRVEDMVRWLRRVLGREPDSTSLPVPPLSGWERLVRLLLIVITAAGVSALLVYAWRLWKRRRDGVGAVVNAEPLPEPDLTDESVTADLLPAEDWLERARGLLAEGNVRAGLRAAYLAGIALLADHEILTIARHKSNQDYRRELARRAHQVSEVIQCFDANVRTFDRVWYGAHDITEEGIDVFLGNLQSMRETLEA